MIAYQQRLKRYKQKNKSEAPAMITHPYIPIKSH